MELPFAPLAFVPFDSLAKVSLAQLTVAVGVVFSIPQIIGLAKPKAFGDGARKFPRSEIWGYVLMAIGTLWFLSNLNNETISDFANYKKAMLIGFGSVGLLTCIFVRDYLAVRGLAIVLLMVSHWMLNTARWHDSQWRLVISVWAYVWIIAGMWFTVSPWRLRDIIEWMTASEKRIRIGSAVRLALGLMLVFLGIAVF